jgi:hypothetical protein
MREAAITLPLDVVEELIRLAKAQTGPRRTAKGNGPPVILPEETVRKLILSTIPSRYGLSIKGQEAVEIAEREVAQVKEMLDGSAPAQE